MWAASDQLDCEKVEVLVEQNTVIKDGKLANSNVMGFWVSERVGFGTSAALGRVTSPVLNRLFIISINYHPMKLW